MDEIKVSQLDAVDEVRDTDVIMEISGGANKKATIQQVKDNIVKDEYGTADDSSYSQNYENKHNVVVSPTTPTTSERVWFKQGKNLIQPFNSRNFNGLTFATNENGKTTITGTTTASGSFNELMNIELKAGTYTFSANMTGSVPSQSSQLILRNSVTNTNIVVLNLWSTTTTQITLAEDTLIDTLRFYSNANITFNITFELQLEEGDTATTYEKYITPSIIVDDKIIYSEENDKWFTLDLGSEFKNYNNELNYQPQIKINGNVVTIRGIVSPKADITNTGAEHIICTIPEKYRPKLMPLHQVCQASGMNRWLLIVGIGGNVTMSRYGTTDFLTAPASSWLPFTFTYLV